MVQQTGQLSCCLGGRERSNRVPVWGMRREIINARNLTGEEAVREDDQREVGLDLAEILQDGVDQLEGVVNLVADLGTSEDNLAAHKDQEHNLGLDHAVDETGEQLRLVGAEVVVARSQTLQADRELDIAGADDVLDLEVRELGVEACGRILATYTLPQPARATVTYRASG